MPESFERSFSNEGKLFNNPSIAVLRKYAHETDSAEMLERVHDILLEKLYKDPENDDLQNLTIFAYLRLETFAQFDSLVQRIA